MLQVEISITSPSTYVEASVDEPVPLLEERGTV